ncbi:MAG: hypothetical protein LC808_34320 [Actinobacteria bacterium]|nr:hypothetical protein [Actinomycetota bacterium]
MNSAGTLRYSVQSGGDRSHIKGSVETDDGVRRSFEGWLGLLSTLESLIGASPEPRPDERGIRMASPGGDPLD